MKIACIGDVHGNLQALQAVLADAVRRGAEEILNVGDSVGYGACPEQVISRLRKGQILSLQGNYDRKMLKIRKKKAKWSETKRPEKLLAFQWAFDHLSKASRSWLAELPREQSLERQGKKILLVHICQDATGRILGHDSPPQVLEELARQLQVDVVICGHTHRPFALRGGGCLFINTGSVGRPEGDPRASYALLDLGDDELTVEHVLVEYDVEEAVAAIRQADLPEEFAQMLYLGIDFDEARRRRFEAVTHLGSGKTEALEAAERLALRSDLEEVGHARQVARLALRIYDELQQEHGLGTTERFWLHLAALLHDIGWSRGDKAHHKASADMILESEELPFGARRRLMVANIARYHRKALPSERHRLYATLNEEDRRRVRILAGILRAADALDLRHMEIVRDLECRASAKVLRFICRASAPMSGESRQLHKKADLLEQCLDRTVRLEWREYSPSPKAKVDPKKPRYNHLRQIPLWARAGIVQEPGKRRRQVEREADIRNRHSKGKKKSK